MALPSQRTPARALTAAAAKLNARETSYSRRLAQPWQLRSLGYYDTIGELSFTAKFLARQISRVRFYPARLLPDQTTEPILEGPPVDLLNQIQDPGGGRSRLQFDYGRLMFITGEGVLFGYEDGRRWKFLWKDEVKRLENGDYVRLDVQQQETDEIGTGYRMWTPHPRHSDLADSPMRSVQDIAEELLILTLSVRSTALSRMGKGIFKIPQEVSPNPLSVGLDEDPQQNPLLSDWMEHTAAQIEQPGSTEAMQPFLIEAPYDYLDRITWEKTHDPATDYMERDLRIEAIKRLALSLDMSPEDLLGYTDANHWSTRAVQLDRWRMFGFNKAQQFADDLADAYLRPALRDDENFPDDEIDTVVVDFDDSMVVISPDRTEDADKALDRIAIGFAQYREMKGIPETGAPTDEEKAFLTALKTRGQVQLEDGQIVQGERGPLPGANGDRNPSDGPPAPGVKSGVSRQESMTASIHGAALMAVHRCRELAGIRIRHKCGECGGEAENHLVASTMGTEEITDPMKLVSGGADGFESLLREWGFAAAQAAALKQQLELWAARTIFQPKLPELPSGFVSQVEKAREVSDAVVAA